MLVCKCLHVPSFGEQLRTRDHRSVLSFELGIEGCWFLDMIILMASTLNVLKDVQSCHMEGFKMIYWWSKGQDVTLSKIGYFYFDWSIHMCKLNYKEIWARYSDLESNTYHIYLISVATYDFLTPLFEVFQNFHFLFLIGCVNYSFHIIDQIEYHFDTCWGPNDWHHSCYLTDSPTWVFTLWFWESGDYLSCRSWSVNGSFCRSVNVSSLLGPSSGPYNRSSLCLHAHKSRRMDSRSFDSS